MKADELARILNELDGRFAKGEISLGKYLAGCFLIPLAFDGHPPPHREMLIAIIVAMLVGLALLNWIGEEHYRPVPENMVSLVSALDRL